MCRKPIASEYLKLTEFWDAAKQETISENVRKVLEEKFPECQTVYAWMNKSRNNVKVPLIKLCMIANELDVDVLELLK